MLQLGSSLFLPVLDWLLISNHTICKAISSDNRGGWLVFRPREIKLLFIQIGFVLGTLAKLLMGDYFMMPMVAGCEGTLWALDLQIFCRHSCWVYVKGWRWLGKWIVVMCFVFQILCMCCNLSSSLCITTMLTYANIVEHIREFLKKVEGGVQVHFMWGKSVCGCLGEERFAC